MPWTMKFHLSVLILAVSYSLVTSQPQAIPGGTGGAVPIGDVSAVAQLGTETSTCTNLGDVIFIVDRSAGQSTDGFGVVKDFLKRLMTFIFESGLGNCYRTALLSFSKKPKVEYDFMSGSLDAVHAAIDGMKNPKGQGFTHKALLKAINLFNNDENPSFGNNRIVMLFTDGASKDKTATIEAAKTLQFAIGPRVLIGKSIDPESSTEQQFNRDKEISDILANSVCDSKLVYELVLDAPLPDILLQAASAIVIEESHYKLYCLHFENVQYDNSVPNKCTRTYTHRCNCVTNKFGNQINIDETKPCECSRMSCLQVNGEIVEEFKQEVDPKHPGCQEDDDNDNGD